MRNDVIVTHCLLLGIYYNVLKDDGMPRWVTLLAMTITYAIALTVAHLATRSRKP